MTETAAAIEPTSMTCQRWDASTRVTGDYLADCAELAREALSHVGFTHFEETPYADVLACREGDLLTEGELPERLRFDVVGVCMSATEPRVRVHHVRGA